MTEKTYIETLREENSLFDSAFKSEKLSSAMLIPLCLMAICVELRRICQAIMNLKRED